MSRRPAPVRLLLWRARVPLTVLGLLAIGALALDVLRPAPEPSASVLVAARSLEAGTELAARDVRVESWPARLVPREPDGDPGEPVAVEQVVGRSLAVDVVEGMPLLGGTLANEDWWAGAPAGSVAAPVRLADPELAGLLRAGDRVDVLAASVDDGAAERVARRALVLTGTAPAPPTGGLLGGAAPVTSGLVLVAVTPLEAEALAGRAVSGVLSAVLVQ